MVFGGLWKTRLGRSGAAQEINFFRAIVLGADRAEIAGRVASTSKIGAEGLTTALGGGDRGFVLDLEVVGKASRMVGSSRMPRSLACLPTSDSRG